MIEFDYNKLNNLRIYELRDLARNVGVKSPTSMKKEEIIEKILLILSGEDAPYVNVTKQGRPAKSQHKIDELVDFFMPKINQTEQSQVADYHMNNDDRFEFFANAGNAEYNNNEAKAERVSGHLDIQKNGYGIIRVHCTAPSEEDVFLHYYSIKTNRLQTGDLLEGEAKRIQEGRPRVMISILKVNGHPLAELKDRVLFSDLPYHSLEQKLLLQPSAFGEQIKPFELEEGSRNLILGDSFSIEQVKQVAGMIPLKEYELFVLHLNAMPEEKKPEGEIQFLSVPFSSEDSVVVSCANLLVEKAKREVEQGKKVVLVINKLTILLKSLSHLDSGTYSAEIPASSVGHIKNILMCAKNISTTNNLTLLVLESTKQEAALLNFVQYDLANLVNKVILVHTKPDGSLQVKA